MTRRVVPIDIDFAGWTEIEEGQHNAWAVVQNGTLLGSYRTKADAESALAGRSECPDCEDGRRCERCAGAGGER